MEHDEFVGQVQNRARLGSRGDAERAIRATLETLAERIADGTAQNLAAQLPVEIDADKVKAECRDGILALYLPRAERDKPRAIQLS